MTTSALSRVPSSKRSPIATRTAGVVSVVAVPLLIVGPLYHGAPVWDAKNVSETLTGRVIQNGTNLTQIVSFVGRAVESELSGNMIDLCPVGALTSEPFRYKARTWELSRRKSIQIN